RLVEEFWLSCPLLVSGVYRQKIPGEHFNDVLSFGKKLFSALIAHFCFTRLSPSARTPSYQDFRITKKVPTSPLVSHKNHANSLRVAIIGAGASGLCSVKALKEVGITPECFEMGTLVGGLWAIENENGRGGAYESLHINTSTKEMEFSDFPMRADIGDFPKHHHIAEYFTKYAEQFDLSRHVHFRKEVVKCTPDTDGYVLQIRESGEISTAHFDAVI